MLELFTKKPVFQGNDEIHQLEVIHKLLGTPNPERWPTLVDLPWYELARPRDEVPNHFREIFQKYVTRFIPSSSFRVTIKTTGGCPQQRWI